MPSPHIATSVFLTEIVKDVEESHVTVGWLIARLGERSFGLTLFMLGLLALVPGASTFVGILIAWPAIQLILGHRVPLLPGRISRRRIEVRKLSRALSTILPTLRWVERMVKPRWDTVFRTSKRITGTFMLLLGVTLISPFPFSHLIPAFVIMLLALAYLEEDGVVLRIALLMSMASIAITIGALWGAVETIDWLDPA